MRTPWTFSTLVPLVAAVAFTATHEAAAAAFVPTGFADSLIVGGFDEPVNFDFTPDGRVLLVERTTARIRLVVHGAISAIDPVCTVPNVRTDDGERGLLGLAVHPSFPAIPYVYVHWSDNTGPWQRISRFTVAGDLGFTGDGSLSIDPATRYDLIADIRDANPPHNGGNLIFGPDGMLYASLGDDNAPCYSQDLNEVSGKILRLDVSGLPDGPGGPPDPSLITPDDNPFVSHPNPRARWVWQMGLRNPWGFAFDSLTGDLWIADVGANSYEEIDLATEPGMNFGWPHYEGPLRRPFNCPMADTTSFVPPVHAYPRNAGATVIAGFVYRRPATASVGFPSEYEGDFFFGEFYLGWWKRLRRTETGAEFPPPVAGQPSDTTWCSNVFWSPRARVGPDGAVWYTRNWVSFPLPTGELRRIVRVDGVVHADPQTPGVVLSPPFPSPARDRVRARFFLAQPTTVRVSVHDVRGRMIARLAGPEWRPAGHHEVAWDGRSGNGSMASGVYWLELVAAGERIRRPVVWIR